MKTPAFIHSPSSVGFTDTARVAGCDTTGSTPGRVPSTIPKRAEQGKESVGRTFVAGKGEGGQEERADRLQPRGRKASLLIGRSAPRRVHDRDHNMSTAAGKGERQQKERADCLILWGNHCRAGGTPVSLNGARSFFLSGESPPSTQPGDRPVLSPSRQRNRDGGVAGLCFLRRCHPGWSLSYTGRTA